MFLFGLHGPLRRRLACRFCEVAGRGMEYIALTRDTTEVHHIYIIYTSYIHHIYII